MRLLGAVSYARATCRHGPRHCPPAAGAGPADGNPNSPGDGNVKLPSVPSDQPELYGEWMLVSLLGAAAVCGRRVGLGDLQDLGLGV